MATERADGVVMEPLKDAMLVKDVGAGHGAEPCHHLYSSWVLLVLMICRISQSLKADGTVVIIVHGGVVVSSTSLSPRIALLEAGMRARFTSTETGFTPGWETPSVLVSQPGARIRD